VRRKVFSIWSILLVLVVSLGVLGSGCPPTGGTIEVYATLDGLPWEGLVDYTLTPDTGSPINGTSVNATHSSAAAGNWTCAYVSGGPGLFVDITPSPTQTLADGATIDFTLNFVTPAPSYDASISFVTWTINGVPVPPGVHPLPPNSYIDIEYEEHVDGPEVGELVAVDQVCWLQVHLIAGDEPLWLHVVNADAAVKQDPPATKTYQDCTVFGTPVYPCDEVPLYICEPVTLDVEVGWEKAVCTNYTKTINWLGFPSPPDILFDAWTATPGTVLNLTARGCIYVEGDTNPDNDCTDWCSTLQIIY